MGGPEAVTWGRSLGAGARGVAEPSGSKRESGCRQRRGGMASTALEIIAFTVSISGWVLVSSTLPTDYWKVSTIDGTVITTATYFANLWKMCVTDSTGVANCKDFPSMLALNGLHPFGVPPPSPFLLLAGFPGGRVLLGTCSGTSTPPGGRPGPTLPHPGGGVCEARCPVGRLLNLGTIGGGSIGSIQVVEGDKAIPSSGTVGTPGLANLPAPHQKLILIEMTPRRSIKARPEIPLAGSLSL